MPPPRKFYWRIVSLEAMWRKISQARPIRVESSVVVSPCFCLQSSRKSGIRLFVACKCLHCSGFSQNGLAVLDCKSLFTSRTLLSFPNAALKFPVPGYNRKRCGSAHDIFFFLHEPLPISICVWQRNNCRVHSAFAITIFAHRQMPDFHLTSLKREYMCIEFHEVRCLSGSNKDGVQHLNDRQAQLSTWHGRDNIMCISWSPHAVSSASDSSSFPHSVFTHLIGAIEPNKSKEKTVL